MSINPLRKNVLPNRGPKMFRGPVDYKPIKWSQFFDTHGAYNSDAGYFHYYSKGKAGPILVCLHGGGYSGLTWSLFAQEISTRIECRLVAIDLRGHGNTNTTDESNLSLEQFTEDVKDIVKSFTNDEEEPPIVLIGHSLGGAVAVSAAPDIPNLVGIVVIDVVEGTALDSLSIMQGILRGRPKGFQTIEQAVQWGYRGGSTQNLEAARVSMPGQIKNARTNVIASEEVELDVTPSAPPMEDMLPIPIPVGSIDAIEEEAEETKNDEKGDEEKAYEETIEEKHEHELAEEVEKCDLQKPVGSMKPPLPSNAPSARSPMKGEINYLWRIDLTKTEQYWPGWFKGLSQKFLDIQSPKILLLANISGLDTCLTVGQMQGKFQMQVLPRSGHAVHEDQPEHVADIIASFLSRQKLAKTLQGFVSMIPGC